MGEFNFGRADIVLGPGISARPPVLSGLVGFGYGPGCLLDSRYVSRFHGQESNQRTMDVGRALVLLFSKPLIEIAIGSALFVSDLGAGVENVALAHFVGVVAGVGLGVSTVVSRGKPAPTANRMKWIAG